MVFLFISTSKVLALKEGRVDEIAADLMLLTVNDVCVSLFVDDCFPIAGISILFFAGLGKYLLWIDISGTSSFTDVVPEFLEAGRW
jgi:hypothetical protein